MMLFVNFYETLLYVAVDDCKYDFIKYLLADPKIDVNAYSVYNLCLE